MTKRRETSALVASSGAPLIGVPAVDGDREIVRYVTDPTALDAAEREHGIQRALALAGAWSDLDWTEAEADLDRIRHGNPPTPPIEL